MSTYIYLCRLETSVDVDRAGHGSIGIPSSGHWDVVQLTPLLLIVFFWTTFRQTAIASTIINTTHRRLENAKGHRSFPTDTTPSAVSLPSNVLSTDRW